SMNQTTSGNDSFILTSSTPVHALGGNDTIFAPRGAGHIEAYGDAGNDILFSGWSGGAHLDGGAGDDRLTGTSDDDLLVGGDGDDYLNGLAGSDVLQGGLGDDTYEINDLFFGEGKTIEVTDTGGVD